MRPAVFQIATVTQILADDLQLAEALSFPEISALDEAAEHWRTALQAKAKAILEDSELSPAFSLHRRRVLIQPETHQVAITLEPPQHSPVWQEAVTMRLPVARWMEEEGSYYAYIPSLRILVFASRPLLLEQRIQEHARLVLMGRRQKITLRELAQLARIESLQVGQLEVTAKLPTPLEIAKSQGAESKEASMLDRLAEELPPRISKEGPAKPRDDASGWIAYEMETELRTLAEALAGPPPRSILLVGPAGCGKTALVNELARRRREFGFGHTPFWSTGGARLMLGPIGFGMWQERCQKLCQELARTRSILHLRNLGELLEVGKTQRGQPSVGSFLRPWIGRGEVLAIAECTPEQLSWIEREDPQLLGAFQQLSIPEPTAPQARAILGRVFEAAAGKAAAERATGLPAALDRLHQLDQRYALYSAKPGRAIRFLKNLLADHPPEKGLTEAEVTTAFARETGLPPVLLNDHVPLDLDETREWFASRLIGQSEATRQVIDLLAIIKARLARPRKPLASLLFIGPTGTGKTELAKALAEFLFGDAARLARFDLNQFNDPAALQRLMGGPLAGSPEGLLTARVREQPFSVLLLDEFEKADPGFFNLLLQILGDGRLTDGAGRVADFSNCVIVMTSNLGASGFQRGPAGFQADGRVVPEVQEYFTEAVQRFLRPEIYNRLDAIVPFRPLSPEAVLGIAQRQIDLLGQRDGLRLRPVELRLRPEVTGYLARNGYDVRYGARPLKRLIERELLAPLAEVLTQYAEPQPLTATVQLAQDRIRIDVKSRPAEGGGAEELEERSAEELARAVTAQRRQVTRLRTCSATNGLANRVTMSESLARRLARAKWKNPEQQAQVAQVPELRECLADITVLQEQCERLETEALTRVYQGQPLEQSFLAHELNRLEKEHHRLRREVFRLQLDHPHDIVLAVYSENRGALLELATAYYGLAKAMGQVVALDFFLPPLGGRSTARKVVRETPRQAGHPFAAPPDKLLGLAMHLRGDLFFPRFEGEAGLHILKGKSAEQVCLVETRPPPFAEYHAPEGMDRPGTIKSKRAPRRRLFHEEKKMVEDLTGGSRPWRGGSLEPCLKELLEERLAQAIEAVTRL